jgi:YVTN family beta-propeller protein
MISKILALSLIVFAPCLLWTRAVMSQPLPSKHYHLVRKIVLGGAGGWDYLTLDSAAHRLYITRGTKVTVLNVNSGAVIGEIPHTSGVHGVAIAPKLGRGFTSNGKSSTVTVFDLKTLRVLAEVKTQANPDAIAYEPVGEKVFVFNGKSNSATVFNAKNNQVLGNIELGGKPEFAVADGLGRIYVNIEDKHEVLTLDAESLTIKTRSPLSTCTEPTGIAIDKLTHRLFIGCHNKMMVVVDANSGEVKATLPIGGGTDAAAFDPQTGLIFSSNGDGSLTVIHEDSPDKFHLVSNVPTRRGARTMALDLNTHKVYLATAKYAPPSATLPGQKPMRPKPIPGTFEILVFGY